MMRPTVDVNPVNLSGTDRKYFYDIADKLTDCTYEHAPATSSVNANKNGPSAEGPSGQPSWDGGGVREHYPIGVNGSLQTTAAGLQSLQPPAGLRNSLHPIAFRAATGVAL